MRLASRILAALLMLAATALPAAAQGVKSLGTFDDWGAYQLQEGGGKVCYIASQPTKDQGDYTRRGDIYAMVAHRPQDNSYDVVSFVAGYTFEKGSEVTVQIDGKPFTLFTHDETAWAKSTQLDKQLVAAMKAGIGMKVRGRSSRGTVTNDTYSLRGFTAAYNTISRACDAP